VSQTDKPARCTASTVLPQDRLRSIFDPSEPVSPQSVTFGRGNCAGAVDISMKPQVRDILTATVRMRPDRSGDDLSTAPSVPGVEVTGDHELGQMGVPRAQLGPIAQE
jgi:hypothetical protein